MKAKTLVLVVCFVSMTPAAIPLPSSPSWTSNDNDYSTGGAFAFIDTNRFIDLCTSNGNDMAQNYNSVYLNSAGTLENVASWRSSDRGYFGHCYAGDMNKDGLADLAVAYLGPTGELRARSYFNTGNGLAASPGWKAKDQHSSFDCCLGDVDLDGDLDLAISAGDAYQNETDSARIYRNNNGVLDTLPFWTARSGSPSDAVRFCDIDNDGDLDLFVGQVIPNQDRGMVTMYRNNSGVLDPTPAWVARPGVGWVLRLAFGDYDNDGWLDLAAASNNQTGEPNSIKVFHNSAGTLDTVATFTMLRNRRYSSCVAWADVNGDGYVDLAAGGWWEPVVVFENRAGMLDTVPTWSWYPNPGSLVCEAVLWADVDNSHLATATQTFSGNGQRKLFTIRHRPVQILDSVLVDNVRLPVSAYCFDPLVGWFSLAIAPPPGTDNVTVFYRYSTHPDLAVTNWEQSYGNHLFKNTTPVGTAEEKHGPCASRCSVEATPNPFTSTVTMRLAPGAPCDAAIYIYDRTGSLVRTLAISRELGSVRWDGLDAYGDEVPPGVYLAVAGQGLARIKLVHH